MLDFACISLSDLLVPWERIQKRLEAVAAGDLTVRIDVRDGDTDSIMAAMKKMIATIEAEGIGEGRQARNGPAKSP